MNANALDRILSETGASYRQIDYWTASGRIHPIEGYGSGNRRRWSPEELRVVRLMVRLTQAGFTVQGAHDAARELVEGRSSIAPGVDLSVNEEVHP